MKNRTQPKIAILSSVKPWIFSSLANDPKYTSQEREKALMQEIDVWNSTLEIDYIKENTKFEVINIINWLPKSGIYDGYILGWSPNMVWEDLDWIKNLKKFIYEEINGEKNKTTQKKIITESQRCRRSFLKRYNISRIIRIEIFHIHCLHNPVFAFRRVISAAEPWIIDIARKIRINKKRKPLFVTVILNQNLNCWQEVA